MKTIVLHLIFMIIGFSAMGQYGIITTVAGSGSYGYSGDGGAATAATFSGINGIAVDEIGNIYVADTFNSCVRKINTAGIISTFAGTGSWGFGGDGGPATAAYLYTPLAIAVDGSGNVYIADAGNNCVRKINTAGIISTFAGTGSWGFSGDGGPATAATLYCPNGVEVDGIGNVYISDYYNCRIRKVNNLGIITTIAGNGLGARTGDGGPATAAGINAPYGVTIDNEGNIYIDDYLDNVIRKVNSAGIISTFAGTGSGGYYGDGGAATSAKLKSPLGVKADATGNVYISDNNNQRIRKVNTSGIISTIAGQGISGFSGDDSLATLAKIFGPSGITVDQDNNIYFSDMGNLRVRKISAAPYLAPDSFLVYVSHDCQGLEFEILTDSFSTGQHIKTYFGNGTVLDTQLAESSGYGIVNFYQPFSSSGTYTIKHVLYDGTLGVDSVSYSYQFRFCNTVLLKYYNDLNSNCVFDSGSDVLISIPVLSEIDSNGIAIDTQSSSSGMYYTAYGNPGDVYTFKPIALSTMFEPSCPVSGIVSDTLFINKFSTENKYIGLTCNTTTSFDLSINTVIFVSGLGDQIGEIYVQNNASCNPIDATVSLIFSPKFNSSLAVGNTESWNLPDLSTKGGAPYGIWVELLRSSFGSLADRDTIKYYSTVSPISGDIDTLNNNEIIIDTVHVSCDPNELWVSPSRCLPFTSGSTMLTYTIAFMNTGSDTAFNIHILDTLSNNVDVSTMRMVMTSAAMNISNLKNAAGQNILKFDFPNINLLDSSHHGQCSGAIIFTVNTKPALSDSTTINNEAGIYFDYNPVVMTNMVQNKVGCPTGVDSYQPITASPALYPNPATNELIIKTGNNDYTSFTITNIMGQQELQEIIKKNETKVNIAALQAGLYFVTFKGESVQAVQKFVKM